MKRQKHLVHYKKIKIEKGVSLRYFYTFQEHNYLEKKWVLTIKKENLYSPFSLEGIEVLKMIHNFDLEEYEEIREVTEDNIRYKTIIKTKGKIKTTKKVLK